MKYFDKEFNEIKCPYGVRFLDRYIQSNSTAIVLSLPEYQHNDEALTTANIVLAYEWSGVSPLPLELPDNHYVLYFDFVNSGGNVIYYPQWLFFVEGIQKAFREINTTYPLTCASRNFNNNRPGKVYNYQQLKNKNYFNRILITKYKSIEEFDTDILQGKIPNEMLADFILDYNTWSLMEGDKLDLISSMSSIDLPVYTESLFHLIAETTVEHYALSEKTFKVFLAGQIPIMCGPRYAVKHLRELGFDMFDDIIDHNRYDNVANWEHRIDMMHSCIDDIINLDHESIKTNTLDRRLNNFKHLKSKEFHRSILEPIARKIS